jgi:hypothetical protein
MPLTSCEIEVDRRWTRMRDQALSQARAWTTDEYTLIRQTIVSHCSTALDLGGSTLPSIHLPKG